MFKFIIIVLTFVSIELLAQHTILPEDTILLINNENYSKNLRISLRFDNENWKEIILEKKSTQLFDLKKNEALYIKICTSSENDCVEYKLNKLRRYKVYYNFDKNRWDLFGSNK